MSASREKKERKELSSQGLTEKQKQEQKVAQQKKMRAIAYSISGVIIAGLVIVLLIWNAGRGNVTALTVGDKKFTPGDVSYYYYLALNNAWNNEKIMEQYYKQMGLEYTSTFDPWGDLKTQYVDPEAEEKQSYHDAFIESARNTIKYVVARYDAAVAEGFTLSDEDKETMEKNYAELQDAAAEGNYSVPNYLRALYGEYMTEKVYRRNLEMSSLANAYNTAKTAEFADYSDEELSAYYEENPRYLDTYTYEYAYINGTAPDPTDEAGKPIVDAAGNTVKATEDENAAAHEAAKKNAEELVAEVQGGAAFGEVAYKYVAENEQVAYLDEGYTTRTAIGSSVKTSSYGEWLTDPERKEGDVELFDGTYGFYVIQYTKRERDDTPTAAFRHVLFQAPNAEDGTGPSQADLDTARQKAEAVLLAFNAEGTEQTAARFGEIADRITEDGGSKGEGGLYDKVKPGDMVSEINDWIFDAARQPGDVKIIEHIDPGAEDDGLNHYSGVHVVYYVGGDVPTWKSTAETERSTSESTAWSEALEAGYTVTDGAGLKLVTR